ncbi:uncharacterized protein LOC117118681 [Anneissia japonica]|uniref:uncharacterized protein LOC117118681 n=1 Tax=Anneissia japonica TaxID=1529436 RepID=UPI0014259B50|nr:uncharacterized protein LOC117118681 [Anneissia japonica]
MISVFTATVLGASIKTSSQSAHQADGSSPLIVIGETSIVFTRDGKEFKFEGLVVEKLDVDVLAGTPFMELNDIAIRPARRQIILGDGTTYVYGSRPIHPSPPSVRRACVLRAPEGETTIWPGDFIELDLPPDFSQNDDVFALEPRDTSALLRSWPPYVVISSVAGRVRIPNFTNRPQVVKRHEHFCQVRPTYVPPAETSTPPPSYIAKPISVSAHSDKVKLDPDNIVPQDIKSKFHSVLIEYDSV